jgi:hypothetical protein
MLKVLKLSKVLRGLEWLQGKGGCEFASAYRGSNSRGKHFQLSAAKIRESHSFADAEFPGSLNGIIESKKSAEWWNAINDKNREWTDRPNQQKSQTQPDYDLVHITSMRKARMRLFFTLTVTFLWYSRRRFRRE